MSGRTTPDWSSSNDPTRSSNPHDSRTGSTPENTARLAEGGERGTAARPKRIACIICRKRKLRCDGTKPSCGTCSKLGHKCAYDEVRRKSGPKRGYVKQLEARLAQVETQLKSKNNATQQTTQPMPTANFPLSDAGLPGHLGDQDMAATFTSAGSVNIAPAPMMPNLTVTGSDGTSAPSGEFSWEMIGLGLEEPLPPADIMDDLHQKYFETIHPSVPMVHKYRYLAALNLAPHMRPAVCLRYAMWALACSVTEKYMSYAEIFYQRARKYAETDEMKGHGECFVTVGHAQCWILTSCYEFKMMYFPRAWMSSGRASRLTLMLGLHRMDGTGLEVKQTLPPPRDWTDKEERRRTFWMSFCNDRYASIGTGWPMVIEERDILTNLPATNEAYEKGQPQETTTLPDALTADGAVDLSSTAGVALIACLFGRNLTHLHRVEADDRPSDPVNGEFWKRHRKLDSILTNTLMFLPEHLRTPFGAKDPNVLFLNVNIHAAVICLHQAAILNAEKNNAGADIMHSSTDRCFAAAEEIINIMKLVSHIDSAHMNPFLSFCLYVAARVFTHAHKRIPHDETIRTNLEFLLNTMQAHRRKNNLTESFLVQLVVELEAAGLPNPLHNARQPLLPPKRSNESGFPDDSCITVFQTPSETQPTFHEIHRNSTSRRPSVPVPNPSYSKSSSSQFSLPFTVSHRESRAPIPSIHRAGAPAPAPPILMSHGWGPSHRATGNVSIDTYRMFDAEMSSEEPNDRVGMSGQPTPNDSHRSSSHTSYSPPQEDHATDQTDSTNPPFFQPPTQYQPFTAAASKYPPSPSPTTNDFTMTGGWDMSAEPLAAPLGDQQWAPVLEPMEWPDVMGGWRPVPAVSHAGR